MTEPKINITIPFYNRTDLVVRAIENALNLDYPNKTITVIDDGSVQNADSMIERFKGEPGLTYLKLSQNVGADSARNVSLLLSQFDYITFHDSDDIYDQRKIRLQLERLQEKEADVAFCKFIHLDTQQQLHVRGEPISLVRDLFPNIMPERFYSYTLFNPGLYSRKVFAGLGGYYPGRFGGDDDLQYRVVLSGQRVVYVDQPLILKLDQPDSVTVVEETSLASRTAQGFYVRIKQDIERYQADPSRATIPISLPAGIEARVVFAHPTNLPVLHGDIPSTGNLQELVEGTT